MNGTINVLGRGARDVRDDAARRWIDDWNALLVRRSLPTTIDI
jgi:hypothetical protein